MDQTRHQKRKAIEPGMNIAIPVYHLASDGKHARAHVLGLLFEGLLGWVVLLHHLMTEGGGTKSEFPTSTSGYWDFLDLLCLVPHNDVEMTCSGNEW